MRKKPEDKKAIGKYASMYMPIGMCIGIGIGMCLGNAIFDNLAIGMSFGVGVGLSLGCAYGASLDKKALNVVEIIEVCGVAANHATFDEFNVSVGIE